MMNGPTRFRINSPKVIQETIEGEVVMVNLDSGNYYSMEKVGADIWGFIENGVSVGEIIEGIAYRYEGKREDIEKAIHQLVSELQREDLIVMDEALGPGNDTLGTEVEIVKKQKRSDFEAPVLHKYNDMQEL